MLTIRIKTLALLMLTALLGILGLAACGNDTQSGTSGSDNAAPASLTGDATKGEALFTSAGCVGCHATTDEKLVGPGLKGAYAGQGEYGANLPNGKPINEANMAEWIKIGGVGKIGQMPGNPALSDQDLADLVAYIKSLN